MDSVARRNRTAPSKTKVHPKSANATNKVVFKLDLSIMLRAPELNFSLWDNAEIHELENYLHQFYNTRCEYTQHEFFNQNWANCDKAIIYFRDAIEPYWDLLDAKTPLKRAIREGLAVKRAGTTHPDCFDHDDELTEKIVQIGKDIGADILVDESDDNVKHRLKTGRSVRLPADKYIQYKNHGDDELKGLLEANKNGLLQLYAPRPETVDNI